MANLVIGCGYLGEPVALEWLGKKRRRQVFATTRTEQHRREMIDLGLTPVVCDVTRPDTLSALPAADTVLYAVGFDRAAGPSLREVYVDGLRNVLEKLPRPRRLLYVSSTGVYGQTDGGWVDEDSPTEPADDGGRLALEAEALLRERLPEAMVLRFAGMYGPQRLPRRRAIEAGEPIAGDPEAWLNLIHLFDGVEAVMAAEKHGLPGRVYNVADGYPPSRRRFFTLLAELLGGPTPTFVSAPGDGHNRRIRNTRMRHELGAHPRYPSYEEGLSATVRWLHEDETRD
jgi:nucleoside-diphosphate-sugar epimerase